MREDRFCMKSKEGKANERKKKREPHSENSEKLYKEFRSEICPPTVELH
jgi:hypothetical protein